MAPAGEVCHAITTNHKKTLEKLSYLVVGEFLAVLDPGREVVNDGEIWIGSNPGFVDGGVVDFIHFGQVIGEGGAVVELEEILIWHGVDVWVADGDGRDNSHGLVVVGVGVFVDGDIERHTRQVWLWGVFVAVAVEVSV